MTQSLFKHVQQWLLTSLVVLTPYICHADVSENSAFLQENLFEHPFAEKSRFNWRQDKVNASELFTQTFYKFFIDSHDITLKLLWNPPEAIPYGLIVANDVENAGVILGKFDAENAQTFFALLINFNALKSAYTLLTPQSCITPNSIEESKSQFRAAGLLLANFIITRTSLSEKRAEEVRALFLEWTNEQIRYIDNAAPSCLNPAIPVNASESNEAYIRSTALLEPIIDLILEAFSAL